MKNKNTCTTVVSNEAEGYCLILINPVQLPLHEPYFDLTPIKVTHTKNLYIKVYKPNYLY